MCIRDRGYMVTGWQWIGGKCYYFASSGAMASNTWIGNDYVDASGAWVPGKVKEKAKWILDGRGWWYRHKDGSYTRSNWEVIGGQWYYFDADGYMVTGWIALGGTHYYLNTSGEMCIRDRSWIQQENGGLSARIVEAGEGKRSVGGRRFGMGTCKRLFGRERCSI